MCSLPPLTTGPEPSTAGSGKEISYAVGHSAVFAFKDERPATFDLFTMLIPGTDGWNVKEFELLQGNESPTGFFQSIGKFQTQNVKLFNTPYQEFKFSPVTAKYLEVKIRLTDAASEDAYTSTNSQDEEYLEEKHCRKLSRSHRA